MRATAWLAGITLAYLLLEAAFNARLIDVLGATQGDVGSPQAIAGLELWGRVISSIAVGLALGTAHVSQMYRHRAPFPIGFVDRRVAAWGRGRLIQSALVIAAAMITTFTVERSLVENGAERQDPITLWWSHYGARASDFGGLALSYVGSDSQRISEGEQAVARYYAEEDITARPPIYADLAAADSKAFIAILPFSMQNWARQRPRSDDDPRPYSATEIQTMVNDGFLETITDLTAQQSRSAILVPVRRCFEMLYDQSPPYETDEPGFPLPVSRCLSRNAAVASFAGDLPGYLGPAVQDCFAPPTQGGERYADYVSLNCVFRAAQDHAAVYEPEASATYLRLYDEAKARALRTVQGDPGQLPDGSRRQVAAGLRLMLDNATSDLTSQQRARLFNPASDSLPACGALEDRLLGQLMRHYSRSDASAWLRRKEGEYCTLFEGLLPYDPAPAAAELFYRLEPDFAQRVNSEVRNIGGGGLGFAGGLPTREQFSAEAERQLVEPVRNRLDRVLQSQFAANAGGAGQLPQVGQYTTLDEFFGNAVVSSLARETLQDLSDSTFQCVGIQRVAQSVRFQGSLQAISTDWDQQFHQRVVHQLEENGVATRFTGLLTDFVPGQRCHAAGVSAYHRATMPGTALIISMAGLLFHAGKLLFYLGGLLALQLRARLGLALGGLALMVAGPQGVTSDLLEQPFANQLIDSFEASHGTHFAAGTRWLIRAELLLYPFSNVLSQDVLAPLGVDFSSETSDPLADARSEQIARVCSKVPQVSQSAEYETLRAFLTNRTFCDSR